MNMNVNVKTNFPTKHVFSKGSVMTLAVSLIVLSVIRFGPWDIQLSNDLLEWYKVNILFLCLSAAFMITIFRGIIVLILGEDYRGAIRIIPFLTLMPILSILFEMTGQGIKFTRKTIYFNYASAAAITCNLIGNTLLVPRYRGVGAALATALTYIVYFFIGTYYSKKCYRVEYDYRGFVISLILYMGYAAFSTVSGNVLTSALAGLLVLLLHLFFNRKTLAELWELSLQTIKEFRSKK